jgi:hypothetical protein
LQNLVFKVANLHYYLAFEQIVALMVDLILGCIFALLLPVKFEILAPSWAISGAPTHLISSLALERSMVLD